MPAGTAATGTAARRSPAVLAAAPAGTGAAARAQVAATAPVGAVPVAALRAAVTAAAAPAAVARPPAAAVAAAARAAAVAAAEPAAAATAVAAEAMARRAVAAAVATATAAAEGVAEVGATMMTTTDPPRVPLALPRRSEDRPRCRAVRVPLGSPVVSTARVWTPAKPSPSTRSRVRLAAAGPRWRPCPRLARRHLSGHGRALLH